MQKHIMLDLETLGTSSNAVIVSIGAVKFTADMIEDVGFYQVLNLDQQQKAGRTIDADTTSWWLKQSEEARAVFKRESYDVMNILDQFSDFVSSKGCYMWGNGADFDCVILGSLYEAFGRKKPWSYSNNRCFRTLKNIIKLQPGASTPARLGVHHNALADALYQAQCAQVYLTKFKGVGLC